ncbi:aconitate hydratase [Tyzzerella sp. OttesenSCG-928-J15]|nr:aconitate hydratase [Tyzzerella sp. OttesenSCG-928-J15]
MNMTRKLIKSHLTEVSAMKAGDEIYIKIDQTLTHDITAVMGYLAFEALNLPRVQTELSVSYIDHNLLYIDNKTPDDHIYLQSIAKKYGIHLSRAGNGICHTVHYSRFGKPGKTLLGTDSHTTSGGAIGMFAFGGGGMDVATAMAGLPIRLRMPEVVKVHLTGKLRGGVNAKDVILEMLRRFSVKGGVGKVFEYVGLGAETLSVPERVTIANMGAELGATTSIFPADEVVRNFLKGQGRESDYTPLYPDDNCSYDSEVEINLSELEPMVALPHMPDNVVTVKEAEKKPVQQVYIGSCTNGSYSDIKKAAAVLKGKVVHEDVSLTVSISSKQIYLMLLKNGVIEDLIASGARLTEIACGACSGIGQAPSTGGISIRTSNRNFKGRGGTADANLYLVSPEVAAATAITGALTDPRDIMEDVSILEAIVEPDTYPVDDSLIIKPLTTEEAAKIEIIRGPNIKPLPVNTAPAETVRGKVSLKAGDNISTDDITPANAQFSSMRSNIPLIAEYAFSRYAPDFVSTVKENKPSFIIGGDNYGQGSSREHAAITPMFWGVKAIITKSFARIHKNNLINHGVIPLVFENPNDYDNMDFMDELEINDLPEQIKNKEIIIANKTKGTSFKTLLELTNDEVDIILAGGQLPYIKSHRDNK